MKTAMVESIKSNLATSAQPALAWLQAKGMDFACNLTAALIILLVGAIVIHFVGKALRALFERKLGGHELLVQFLVSAAVKCAWAVLIIVVLEQLDVAVAPLVAGLGVTGVILGFAFQESLGSFAAGIMIAFNQPFKIGDYVRLGEFYGLVKQLDMMAVVITTFDNQKITIPNKQVWSSAIVNFSSLGICRVDVPFDIAYGSDILAARELALQTLRAVPVILKAPPPMAEIDKFTERSITLLCRIWVKCTDFSRGRFAANAALIEAFKKAGYKTPYPVYVDLEAVVTKESLNI